MPPADAVHGAGSTRRTPLWLLALAAVFLALRIGIGIWEHTHPPKVVDQMHWTPLPQAAARAIAEQRPILYVFSAAWCTPCQQMEREVFADADQAQRIDRTFVTVEVMDRMKEEGRNPPDVDALQKRYGVDSFPTLVATMPGSDQFSKTSGYDGITPLMVWLSQAARTAGTPPAPGVPGQLPH